MIKPEEVAKLTELARLEMSAEERTKIGQDLSAILDYVSELKSAGSAVGSPDLGRSAPGNPKSELPTASLPVNIWRADLPTPSSATREELLASAAASQDGYFKVKKILG